VIGAGYLCGSLIVLHSQKLRWVLVWLAFFLAVNAMIQFLVPVPGFGRGVFTPQGLVNYYVDRVFMPGGFPYYITPDGTPYALDAARPPKSAQRLSISLANPGSSTISSSAISIPRRRQYISYTHGDTSQPIK